MIKNIKSMERKRRLEQLGGFGKKRTQVVRDRTKYSRKNKHKGNY
jgi:hypothetical protein